MDGSGIYIDADELGPPDRRVHWTTHRAMRPSSFGGPPRPEKHLRERVRAEREARVPVYAAWLERHPGEGLDCAAALAERGGGLGADTP